MPRLIESKGRIVFRTPFPDELQRYLYYELENSKQWNKDKIIGGIKGSNTWEFSCITEVKTLWTIMWNGKEIIAISDLPMIVIRQGLRIGMGHGRIIIESVGAP